MPIAKLTSMGRGRRAKRGNAREKRSRLLTLLGAEELDLRAQQHVAKKVHCDCPTLTLAHAKKGNVLALGTLQGSRPF